MNGLTTADGKSRIHDEDKSTVACDHWNLYPNDTLLMKEELFVDSYRFSIEWSKVQEGFR